MPVKPWYRTDREYENTINEIRVEKGVTLKSLAKLIGVGPTYLWHITQGYVGPTTISGNIKSWACKLEIELGYDLSEIFPREFCNIQKRSNLTEDQIIDIVHGYNTPETFHDDILIMLDVMNKYLTDRENEFLRYRFIDEMTLQEISDVSSVSRERVRQIVAKALRKIREKFYRMKFHVDL